jgi:hypothetical protein
MGERALYEGSRGGIKIACYLEEEEGEQEAVLALRSRGGGSL